MGLGALTPAGATPHSLPTEPLLAVWHIMQRSTRRQALQPMQPISSHFAPELQKEFTDAIPRLRKQMGSIPFAKKDYTFGVGGETLRALSNLSNRPSDLYRTWAARVCDRLTPATLAKLVATAEAFEAWHAHLVADLQKEWEAREGARLLVAHQYKLVDLLFKWLSWYDFGDPAVTRGFEAHAHCPLDTQSLTKLNECLSHALPMRHPSMKNILTEHTYVYCQDLISEFTRSCGGTPLLFDYFAWKRGG